MSQLQTTIEAAFEARDSITPSTASQEIKDAVNEAIALLNSGEGRVAEKVDGEWVVHQWLKKAVLLYFRCYNNDVIDGAETHFDKVPLNTATIPRKNLHVMAHELFLLLQLYRYIYW